MKRKNLVRYADIQTRDDAKIIEAFLKTEIRGR